jgi:hypothetical protein
MCPSRRRRLSPHCAWEKNDHALTGLIILPDFVMLNSFQHPFRRKA